MLLSLTARFVNRRNQLHIAKALVARSLRLLIAEDALRKVIGFALKLVRRWIISSLVKRRLACNFRPNSEAVIVERGLYMEIAL